MLNGSDVGTSKNIYSSKEKNDLFIVETNYVNLLDVTNSSFEESLKSLLNQLSSASDPIGSYSEMIE